MKRALRDPIVIALIVMGLAISIGVAVAAERDEEETASKWLSERAELIARATEETVDRAFADLRATAAFMQSTPQLTQREFDDFVARLEMNPGVIGIGYVAVVAGPEITDFLAEARRDVPQLDLLSFDGLGGIGPNNEPRQTYYPLRFVHGGPFLDIVIAETPIASQVDALGFDVATEPLWSPAFEKALVHGSPSVSELLGIGGVFEEQAFGVAHPLTKSDGSVEGVLVAPGLEILLTSDLGVAITNGVTWQVDNTPLEEDDWPVWQRGLDLPGSTWTLSVEPTAASLAALSSDASRWILAVGFVLTAAMATVAYQVRSRRRESRQLRRLSQLAEDKDRFLATVSHELRTPLTVVIGLAAELRGNGGVAAEEREELLRLIEDHGHEAGAIVEDLLVAARSDIDRIAVRPERVDAAAAIAQAIAASPFAEVPVVGACPPLLADPARIQQILRNLLTNADRYGGPEVEVRLSQSGALGTVVVADSGDALSPEQKQAIFDPYTSAHDHGQHLGSIGLGLFISQKLAQLMGGDLLYRHDGDHGLFELRLPLAEQAEVPATPVQI